MAYVTQQDLVDRFGESELIQLTNPDDFGATTVNADRLDTAIQDAESVIDGYAGGRYQVPLSPVPKVVTKAAADLVRYLLYDESAPDQVAQRYEDAVKFLRAVSRGEVSLGAATGGDTAGAGSDVATVESDGRTFGRGRGGLV